jgi:hypothetical protein
VRVNGDDWRNLFTGLGVLISCAALAFSIVAFLRGLPIIRIDAKLATVFGGDCGGRPMIVVEVVNDGGAAAQVSNVFLDAVDGSLREYPGELGRGPSVPCALAANGGHAVWWFDYDHLRQRAQDQVRDEPLQVRATVKVGSHLRRQRDQVSITPRGSTTHHSSRRERNAARFRSWTHPGVVLYPPFSTASDFDLVNRTEILGLYNTGRGVVRPRKLTLTVRHVDGSRDRVSGVAPVQIPRIWPRRHIALRVPLVDAPEPTEGDTYMWSTTSGKAIGSGYGATTVARAEDFVKRSGE